MSNNPQPLVPDVIFRAQTRTGVLVATFNCLTLALAFQMDRAGRGVTVQIFKATTTVEQVA